MPRLVGVSRVSVPGHLVSEALPDTHFHVGLSSPQLSLPCSAPPSLAHGVFPPWPSVRPAWNASSSPAAGEDGLADRQRHVVDVRSTFDKPTNLLLALSSSVCRQGRSCLSIGALVSVPVESLGTASHENMSEEWREHGASSCMGVGLGCTSHVLSGAILLCSVLLRQAMCGLQLRKICLSSSPPRAPPAHKPRTCPLSGST